MNEQPPLPPDAAPASAREKMAMAFASQATMLLRLFEGREGIVSASLCGAVGLVLQAAGSRHEPKWIDAQINAFEQALTAVSKDVDAYGWALFRGALANAYADRLHGDRADDEERAIACYEDALTVRTRESDIHGWAQLRNNLGNVYRARIRGDRPDNLEGAIACYQDALTVRTRESDPPGWAQISNNLGAAYAERVRGDRVENLERAIEFYHDALTVRTREKDADGWAQTTSNLGNAYRERELGDQSQNLERAIGCYEDALAVRAPESHPRGWATIQNNLGNVYRDRLLGDRRDNLELAIACYEKALTIRTRDRDPQGWAQTRSNLGAAYRARLRGDRSDNLERSIACYEDALTVRAPQSDAHSWATSRSNLGNAYRERLRGDRSDNLERAIACYEDALSVLTPESDAGGWAQTRSNLGVAYFVHPRGDRSDNLERAIACYYDALIVLSLRSHARNWAETRNNLGAAYGERLAGSRVENLERAIACFQDALTVRTRESDLKGWATTTHNLGAVYGDRLLGDRDENLRRAVAYLRDASEAGAQFLHSVQLIRACCREALLLLRLGPDNWREASEALSQAGTVFAERRGETMTSEQQREMLAAMSDVGRWSAIIAVAAGDPASGLERLEASRAVSMREALAIEGILLRDLNADSRVAIETARRQIANLRAEAELPPGAGGARAYTAIGTELREAGTALAAALAATGNGPAAPLNAGEILEAIPAGSTMIVPVATEFGGAIFVVPSGTARIGIDHVVRRATLTSEALRERRTAWLAAYKAAMDAYTNKAPDFAAQWSAASSTLETILDWLWAEVMEPALARMMQLDLGAVSRQPGGLPELLIMPTGDFAVLPLHAAWREQNTTRRTVLDDFVVAYTPSLYASRNEQRKRSRGTAAVGNSVLALVNPSEDLQFSELFEVRALENMFPADMRTILVGGSATKTAIAQGASSRSYLHLSCHASFDRREPKGSGLVLANGERLTGPEIVALLDLQNCRWTMLSACETGMIDVDTTPEEAVGLPAAFRQAGSSCVTAALWSVADVSAALFVGRAYHEHFTNVQSAAQAARRAALWLRDMKAEDLTALNDSEGAIGAASRLRFPRIEDEAAFSQKDRTAYMPFSSPLFWAPFTSWGS